jgi:hypothetical protein
MQSEGANFEKKKRSTKKKPNERNARERQRRQGLRACLDADGIDVPALQYE